MFDNISNACPQQSQRKTYQKKLVVIFVCQVIVCDKIDYKNIHKMSATALHMPLQTTCF